MQQPNQIEKRMITLILITFALIAVSNATVASTVLDKTKDVVEKGKELGSKVKTNASPHIKILLFKQTITRISIEKKTSKRRQQLRETWKIQPPRRFVGVRFRRIGLSYKLIFCSERRCRPKGEEEGDEHCLWRFRRSEWCRRKSQREAPVDWWRSGDAQGTARTTVHCRKTRRGVGSQASRVPRRESWWYERKGNILIEWEEIHVFSTL